MALVGGKIQIRTIYHLHIIYMFSKYNNILLSDESIWHSTHFFKKDLWEILRKESLKSAFKIKIIVYLRRQDAALNSM